MFLDGEVGVTFTLYQLQQELKGMGHSFSLDEIKHALMVCKGTELIIKRTDKSQDEFTLASNMFQTVALKTRVRQGGVEAGPDDHKAFVRFSPLVTKGIMTKTFRLYHYRKAMETRGVLARYLLKRISRRYSYASADKSYGIKLTTLFRDSGMQPTNIRDMKQKAIAALEELKTKEIVSRYGLTAVKEGRRNIDWKLAIFPHKRFIDFTFYANAKSNEIRAPELEQERKKIIDQAKLKLSGKL